MSNTVCNRDCLCCDKPLSPPARSITAVPMLYSPDPELEAIDMALQKKPLVSLSPYSAGEPWLDPEFARDYPNLFAFLNDTKWADGTSRLTGSASLFTKAGTLTVALNDNDRGCVVFLTAGTWAELIAIMDTAVCDERTDWKARSPQKGTGRPPF